MQPIHYGTLDESLDRHVKRPRTGQENSEGITLDRLYQDTNVETEPDNFYVFSETTERARESQRLLLDELERKKRARDLPVPTDDSKVKSRLREYGEPICLFGEGPSDRRDRLRYIMSLQLIQQDISMEDSSDEDVVIYLS